ncbi:hypothetical protein [Clostridium sp. VAP41]|uniref:hypothetical protein n=1 Tax=Clostridium sp. VAP41 TaxID=2949979 RepID=UPI002079C810|nr:hypothetical protein [Clostridium sp. VAP41]
MDIHQIINPFPKQRTKVSGVITNRYIVGDNKCIVTIDLVNDAIKKLDEKLYSIKLDNKNRNEELKKYLFTYFMTIEVDLNEYKNSFKNLSENKLYEIELIPENMIELNNKIKLFNSNVYFSASPISKKEYFASFTGISLPIESTSLGVMAFNNKGDINTELDKVFTYNLNVDLFRIHRVGQGSCNSIIFKQQYSHKLFYDVGISKYVEKDSNYKIYTHRFSMFNLQKFSTIIISHWDEDHYLGVYLDKNRELLYKTWITPKIEDTCLNAKRLGYLISIFGKLIMIDDSIKGHFYNKDDVFLFKGDGNNKNDSGIIIGIKTSTNKNLVAMGDVPYKNASFFSTYLHGCFNQINYLIVPHHGAFLGLNNIFSSKITSNVAVISVGYNQYGHPTNSTVNDLLSNGFKILKTDTDERQIIKF